MHRSGGAEQGVAGRVSSIDGNGRGAGAVQRQQKSTEIVGNGVEMLKHPTGVV